MCATQSLYIVIHTMHGLRRWRLHCNSEPVFTLGNMTAVLHSCEPQQEVHSSSHRYADRQSDWDAEAVTMTTSVMLMLITWDAGVIDWCKIVMHILHWTLMDVNVHCFTVLTRCMTRNAAVRNVAVSSAKCRNRSIKSCIIQVYRNVSIL